MPVVQLDASIVSLHFYIEQREIFERLVQYESNLDLVVLPGISRTGTSVIFQCLYDSGFNESRPMKLYGNPPTEHGIWRIANWHVSKYLGARAFMPGSEKDLHHADILVGDITDRPLNKDIKKEMDDFVGILVWQELRLLKEPMCVYALETWIDNYQCFKNAKYIWTRRDYTETAKSLVRLKVPQGQYRGVLTVRNAEKICIEHDKLLKKAMKKVNHIEVWHHDLINKPDKTFNRISEFVGTKVKTDAFDRGKIWRK